MTDHLLAALTDKPWPEVAMYGGAIGCLLAAVGIIRLYWGRKS